MCLLRCLYVTSYLVRGRGFAFVCAYTRVSKIKRHRGLLQVRLRYRRQIDVNVVERLLAMHLFQMCWAWFVYQHTKRHFEWVSYSSAIAKLVDDQATTFKKIYGCLSAGYGVVWGFVYVLLVSAKARFG